MTNKQPISVLTVKVTDDVFWNWLADETQIDLHDLELVGANALVSGDVEFVVRRAERTFAEEQARHEANIIEQLREDEEDGRFHRQG